MRALSKPLLLCTLAIGCAGARAAAHAELPVCRPDYRAVIVSDSAALVREVADRLRSRLAMNCPTQPRTLAPEAAQRLLVDSLGARYKALLDDRQLSVFIESVP